MKKIICIILTFCILVAFPCVSFAADNHINVFVNGSRIDAKGVIVSDRTLLPMRAFLEKTGFVVEWNGSEKRVVAKKDGFNIDLVIGENSMLVNEKVIELSTPAVIIDGSTYVPVRAIGENVGYTVDWYAPSQTAHLYKEGMELNLYKTANSVMPSLVSVFGSGNEEEIQGEVRSFYDHYSHKNMPEVRAHEYGDILCSDYGYEYDSLELGSDYSKHYLYTIGNVITDIEVVTVDSVSYVNIYPDVNSDNYSIDDAKIFAKIGKYEPKGALEYYDGTQIPKFTYISGIVVDTIDRTEDGNEVYIYRAPMTEVAEYISFICDYGFKYTDDTGIGFDGSYNYVLYKNDEYISISSSMFSNKIYITTYR